MFKTKTHAKLIPIIYMTKTVFTIVHVSFWYVLTHSQHYYYVFVPSKNVFGFLCTDERDIPATRQMAWCYINTNTESIQWAFDTLYVLYSQRTPTECRVRSNCSSKESLRMEWGRLKLLFVFLMFCLISMKMTIY